MEGEYTQELQYLVAALETVLHKECALMQVVFRAF